MEPVPVPSGHDFLDPDYVRRWGSESERTDPQRPALLDAFVDQVQGLRRTVDVLELGSGPGILAEPILHTCPVNGDYLLDFSPAMHALSRERLGRHLGKAVFVEADFRAGNWTTRVPTASDVAVSIQTVHELHPYSLVFGLYRQLRSVLRPGATVLICDHLRPEDDQRPRFMTVDEHLDALHHAGLV